MPDMPEELRGQIEWLEQWAADNKADARRDTAWFWSLKLPAIVVSASSGVWSYLNWSLVAIISGVVASICIVLDATMTPGRLRNAHLTAYHDLTQLSGKLRRRWQANRALTVGKLIGDAEPEIARIENFIRDSETALQWRQEPGNEGGAAKRQSMKSAIPARPRSSEKR